MIVVIGQLLHREADDGGRADGMAARIALAAATAGRSVQFVGKTGEDPEADEALLSLAQAGVGHVAVLRDAGMATPRLAEPIDADLNSGQEDAFVDADTSPAPAPDVGPALDAADIELALRYLTDFSVLVLAVPADDAIARTVSAAAGWADARLIVIVPHGLAIPEGLPPDAIVFEGPDADPDGVFADMVGAFAAALDDGDEPAMAFRSTVEGAGWAPTEAEPV